jgi:hypothetical protein
MAGVVLVPTVVSAVPGGESSCTVRVRNTGQVVDSYTITVLGAPAAWATPMPAVLSLFPGAEGEATISFRPPRSPELEAGPVDFAVRVVATEDPDGSVVEEGVVTLDAYQEIAARITPRTSETKRVARHTVTVDNRGNAPVTVNLAASDPDELLAFDVRPPTLTVAPGQTGTAVVKAMARSGFARGTDRHRPFQATVTPQPPGMHPPTLLDATLVQRAGLPRFVPALVAAVAVIAVAAVMIPILAKNDDGGTIALTGIDGAPTTTVAAGAGDEEGEGGDEAEATAEEGAPATTNPPNRQGSSGGGTAAAGGGTAAAGGGSAPATTAAPTATTEAPGVTTPDAKPVTSTTAAPPSTTTTTAPPTIHSQGTNRIIHGTYSFDADSGNEQSASADAFWRQSTSTTRSLEPRNGALFANFGIVNFDSVTYAQLKSASYSSTPINGSDSGDQMPAGTVIAIKTSEGRWSKVRIEARNVYDPSAYYPYNNHIRVRWVTYNN